MPTRPISVSGNPTRGSSTALVSAIEYTDFECPYCAVMANGSLKQFLTEYVDSGKVLFVVKNLPLPMHRMAPRAATMALCAGEQGKYWEMHDLLFASNGRLVERDLEGLGGQLGVALPAYRSCLESDRPLVVLNTDKAEAADLTIKSTPTFVFGIRQGDGRIKATDVLIGAQPIEELRAVVDKRLKEAAQPR